MPPAPEETVLCRKRKTPESYHKKYSVLKLINLSICKTQTPATSLAVCLFISTSISGQSIRGVLYLLVKSLQNKQAIAISHHMLQ